MKHLITTLLKKITFLLLTTLCFTSVAIAQDKDSKGTDFWLAFLDNYDDAGVELTLFISGDQNTTGTVTVPGIGFSQPFSVTVGNVTSVTIPNSVIIANSDVIEDKGIHVTSKDEVTVYGLSRLQFTTDAFLGLPTDVLDVDYINLGYITSSLINNGGSEFGIVATQNNTVVTITPTVATDGHNAGVAYDINLDQGQTYFLKNNIGGNDLTGTIIHSTKPVALFGGHECANIPPDQSFCDHVVEEIPPASAWGKNFVTVPLKTRKNGDSFRFLASKNGTQVSVNGSLVATLNKGEYFETIIDGSSQIISTEPILVSQYSNGTTFDNVTSDPFMMLIPPYEQFLTNYTITTPATGFTGNYVNVVAPNEAVGSVRVDGTIIPAGQFSAIGSSGFSGAQVDISLGVHTFSGGGSPIGVFVYGYADYDSYGYPGGQAFGKTAEVRNLALAPVSGSASVNTNQCFTATIKNQNNQPLKDIRVDFKILGANEGTMGSDFTDDNGEAKFCYDGPLEGIDTIVATSGVLSDTSYFTRTKTTTNHAPVFDYPPTPADGSTISAHPGENVMFMVKAEDNDAGDHVQLSVTGLPNGSGTSPSLPATDNPVYTKFMWTPGAGDVGTYPIEFTATDDSGKTVTTTVIVQVTSVTCSDTSFRPFVFVYPAFTVQGQAKHTIYKGYGPQSVILAAVPRGGVVNPLKYKYKWDNGSTLPVRRVMPEMTTTYEVDITDMNGCTVHASVTIWVVDVRCGSYTPKVLVCRNGYDMCVDSVKVADLLKNGAKLGSCGTKKYTQPIASVRKAALATDAMKATQTGIFTAYPSPAVSTIRFKWDVNVTGKARIDILDLQGRVIITQNVTSMGQGINISKLSNGVYMAQLIIEGRPMGTTRFTVSK